MSESRTYSVKMSDGSRMDVQTTGGGQRAMEVADTAQADRDPSVKSVSACTVVPVRTQR